MNGLVRNQNSAMILTEQAPGNAALSRERHFCANSSRPARRQARFCQRHSQPSIREIVGYLDQPLTDKSTNRCVDERFS